MRLRGQGCLWWARASEGGTLRQEQETGEVQLVPEWEKVQTYAGSLLTHCFPVVSLAKPKGKPAVNVA